LAEKLRRIAAVERDSGLPKDTLRAWERRYGFPKPRRDENDERVYPQEQVEKLRMLRRLVEAGHRPGQIVSRPPHELAELLRASGNDQVAPSPISRNAIAYLLNHDASGLRAHLQALLVRHGLGGFVTQIAPDLLASVGDAWARGDLEIHQEHLFTDQFSMVLRGAINAALAAKSATSSPRVLLTTPPQEPHSLGLMMAEAMFVLADCDCIGLGVRTPAPDIAAAARAHGADIVALSFSALFPQTLARETLSDLRALMDQEVEIWAGGGGAPSRLAPGLRRIRSLSEIAPSIEAWRASAGDARPS